MAYSPPIAITLDRTPDKCQQTLSKVDIILHRLVGRASTTLSFAYVVSPDGDDISPLENKMSAV